MFRRSYGLIVLELVYNGMIEKIGASLDSNEPSHTMQAQDSRRISPSRFRFRVVLLVVGLILFFFVMQRVLNPFGDKEYAEVPHGNHSHYVPKDRDPSVPISNFPTRPPADNERITSDGRIVPK